jgi:hypothetical protein
MDYRNSGNATHLSKGFAAGVESSNGVELSGSSNAGLINAIGDTTAANLFISAKGTGTLRLGDSSNVVTFGASTSHFGGMNRGVSTMTLVALPASALVLSTVTIPGLGVNDLLYLARPGDSLVSTAIGMVGYTCTAANEAKIAWLNNLASTASILSNTPINFAYIKA